MRWGTDAVFVESDEFKQTHSKKWTRANTPPIVLVGFGKCIKSFYLQKREWLKNSETLVSSKLQIQKSAKSLTYILEFACDYVITHSNEWHNNCMMMYFFILSFPVYDIERNHLFRCNSFANIVFMSCFPLYGHFTVRSIIQPICAV